MLHLHHLQNPRFKFEFDDALTEIDKAILLDSEGRAYYRFKSSIYLKMTDYENALNSIEKTIEQEPDLCYIEDRKKGDQIPMYFYKDEFGEEIYEKTMDDYLIKVIFSKVSAVYFH